MAPTPLSNKQLAFLEKYIAPVRAAAPPADTAARERWKKAEARFSPLVATAVESGGPTAGKIAKLWEFARTKAADDDFAAANEALDPIDKLLAAAKETAKEAKPQERSLVELQKMRLAWNLCRKDMVAQLLSLEAKIVDFFKDASDAAEMKSTAKNLQMVFSIIDERLLDKLDEALVAETPDLRREREVEAGRIAREYLAHLDSHPMLSIIDDNPFQKTTVQASLRKVLGLLNTRLS